jgi:hypothetical protein
MRADSVANTNDNNAGSRQPMYPSPRSPAFNERVMQTTIEKHSRASHDGMDISVETNLTGYEHNNLRSGHQESVFTPFDTSTMELFKSPQQHPEDDTNSHDVRDSFASPNLDMSTWDSLLSFSTSLTTTQHQSNCIDRQILAHSYSGSSGSDSTSLTVLTPHDNESTESYHLDAAHSHLRHLPSPMLCSYPSPVRTPATPRPERSQVTAIRSRAPLHTLNHALSVQSSAFSNIAEEKQCFCLPDVASLLDDLAVADTTKNHQSFDVALGYLKDVLAQSKHALECMRCIRRSEYCMLLAILIEKLVLASEKVTREHILAPSRNTDDRSSIGASNYHTAAASVKFGSYSLSSIEHRFLVRGLMKLYLESCRTFVAKLVHIARISKREGQEALLVETEQHIDRIQMSIEDMTHIPDDGPIHSINDN